ncbi:hypothetical protein B296_00038009, partial [Ensete ventricosum]
ILCKVTCKVEFRSIFCAPSQKFKILLIPNIFPWGKSYEHGFAKKREGHKLCAKSSLIGFSCTSQKFKILAIPNVLAHGKSCEHGFAKKHNGHKHYAKSSFNWFFMHRLKNSKY